MYKTNQLTGNVYNDSEVTINVKEDIRSCYTKYVFLLGKMSNVIVSLVLLAFSTDRNDAFLPFHILQLVKSLPVFIPEA